MSQLYALIQTFIVKRKFWVQTGTHEVLSPSHLQLEASELPSPHWEVLELNAQTAFAAQIFYLGGSSFVTARDRLCF